MLLEVDGEDGFYEEYEIDGDYESTEEDEVDIFSFSQSIKNLSADTTYYWCATIGYGDYGDIKWTGTTDDGEFTTKSPPLDLWDWTVSNGSATASQTQRAYDILMGSVPISDGFSHKVWNDFVDKVMKMRSYKDDGTWDTIGGDYLSYSECRVSAGDTLSADIYNSTRLQIGQVIGTWVDVSPGDEIFGWHIINLAEKLNEAIIELSR